MGRHSNIQLTVTDLDTTEAFYGGILDLPVQRALTAPGAPEHLTLSTDGLELIFVQEEAVLQNHPILAERFVSSPRGVGITFHFRVKDLAGIYEAILEEEMEVLYPLEVKPYRLKELWCFDPDGYLVVLEEPLR